MTSQLWLAGPAASASKTDAGRRRPPYQAVGTAFVLEIPNLADLVARMKSSGVAFRNDIVTGPGGKQILCLDPSGNVVELFESAAAPPKSQ